jgi:hypothetical protein
MSDLRPRRPVINVQLVLGFLLGIVGSLFWVFLAIFLSNTLGPRYARMYPLFIGVGLTTLALIAFRSARRSTYVMGVLIALGLALVADGVYIAAIR